MNIRSIILPALLLAFASCSSDDYTRTPVYPRVDSIDVEEVRVALPRTEGIELVERSCTPCHSLRYIEMQPELSKGAWEKIVTKMIKTYGAPVRDSLEAAAIVRYLVAIKGKTEQH